MPSVALGASPPADAWVTTWSPTLCLVLISPPLFVLALAVPLEAALVRLLLLALVLVLVGLHPAAGPAPSMTVTPLCLQVLLQVLALQQPVLAEAPPALPARLTQHAP